MSYGGNPPGGPNPNQPQPNQNWDAPGPSGAPPVKSNTTTVLLILGGVCLVGFFCLCVLGALLLPAVQSARESGRRAVCLNNMRNLGLALATYETARRAYPGYRDTLTLNAEVVVQGEPTKKAPVNWPILLMPNLERPDLYRNWKNLEGVEIAADGQVTYTFPKSSSGDSLSPLVYQEIMVCPSDPQSPRPVGQGQPISYIVNSGLQDVPATSKTPGDWLDNGVFVSRWEMPQTPSALIISTNADMVSRGDGVSDTVLMSESSGARNYDDVVVTVGGPGSLQKPVSEQWGCFVWQPQDPLPANLSQAKINGRPSSGTDPSPDLASDISYARPSSAHPGGVNFVFCDTHTRFISENIDYYVLALLMMSNDRGARMPGTGKPLPAIFTTTELKDSMLER